jgi:predicted outer membrane protein
MRYDLTGPGPRAHAAPRRSLHLLPAVPALALVALSLGSWDPAAPTPIRNAGVITAAAGTQTSYGPLTAADRDFLAKVRLAGLWEGPTGRQAQRRSANPAVRAAGIHLVAGHAELDAKVLAIGAAFKVALPDEPNADQQAWMTEMTNARTAREYDQIFVDRLRAAHGKVYGLVAQIRAGTRNSVIRSFAQRAMEVVLDHITMLEATGLVNWSLIPLPPSPVPGGSPGTNMVQTSRGPMTDSGRDFLRKVRLAGLWEGPSGRQAQERAGSDAVREAGQHLIDGHAELDATVLQVAAELGVDLPDEPNADQQAWMAEMTNARTPQQYDQVFVRRLRAAHGTVYGLVAQIRAGTRNDLIRAFAQRAMEVVLDHITMLERTGLVNFEALPAPPEPAPSGSAPGRNMSPQMVVSILILAGALSYAARVRFYRRDPAATS